MPDSLSASEYILDNFKLSDRVALLLRNRSTEEVIQRIASAEKIAAPDFQQWLKERNQAGFDIYIGMNALKGGAYTRTKRDIHAIRHVYLDLDYRGPEALRTIQNSQEVPKPNFVLDTSPGKHQVVRGTIRPDRLGGIEVSHRTMELQPCATLPALSPMDQI